MKERIKRAKSVRKSSREEIEQVGGLDVSDRYCHLCVLCRETGAKQEESRLTCSETSLRRRFEGLARMRVALEAGVHSGWISRVLEDLGHEVIVGNPRRLRLIYRNRKKSDKVDAEYLARLARADCELLHPLRHRGVQAQEDLAIVRSRDLMVKTRTQLVNHVRSVVKGTGERLPSCGSEAFAKKVASEIPEGLRAALLPVVETIGELSSQIRHYEREIERVLRTRYPESELLLAVNGVGAITALTFLLVIEDPGRFAKSRKVGAYLGLVPAQDESGESSPELRITREGDELLRRLLVQCGHYILGPFGKDCDLRRHGEKIVQRGGKAAKKRAAVAVARKLAVLLHVLWRNAEIYDPDHTAKRNDRRRQVA